MFRCTCDKPNVFPLNTCICNVQQNVCARHNLFLIWVSCNIKCTMLNEGVALESKRSPSAPDDGAPTPDVELQRLPAFVCPPLGNMWFYLQNVLLLNNVSALELGTLHKDYFVPWCPHGKSLSHCTHTHTGWWWHQQGHWAHVDKGTIFPSDGNTVLLLNGTTESQNEYFQYCPFSPCRY